MYFAGCPWWLFEMARDAAEGAVIDMEGVAAPRGNRPRKRSAQDEFTRCQRDVVSGKLVREPCHAVGRMIEHRRGHTGFLDHAVTITNGRDPAQIGIERTKRTASGYQRSPRSVV